MLYYILRLYNYTFNTHDWYIYFDNNKIYRLKLV